jgi:predicted nucleotide-binding protein
MTTPTTESSKEAATISVLTELLHKGGQFASRPELPPGLVKMWFGNVRLQLRKIYGAESEIVALWPVPDGPLSKEEARPVLIKRIAQLEQFVSSLLADGKAAYSGPAENNGTIFIGHGRSPLWRELKDFLVDRLALRWNEFNRESVAGVATSDRLIQMLDSASFAFLIMTAEDEHADTTLHARANVIHEVGLFQGRLGMRKAIILLEEGCQEFSNIHGLSHIPFPRGHVSAAFEEIRRVLEREQIVRT